MQHKRSHKRQGIFLVVILGFIVGAGALLMMGDVPPPLHPIEKELDAKAFLETKQP